MNVEKHQQFAARVVQNQHRVFRYIVTLVPNRADAEELYQQTCLSLWESWERYDLSLEFVPWACGFAHNHVRNFLRKRQNSQVQLDPDVVELLAQKSQEQHSSEDRKLAALRDCLAGLTERNRLVIEGYYSGETVERIADQRSASPNAIYKVIHRVREILHECVSLRLSEGVSA